MPELATHTLPLVRELDPNSTPEAVFQRFAALPHCLFLDSAMRHPQLGRYSFVAADPCQVTDSLRGFASDQGQRTRTRAGLPPFQGGWAGLFCYELAHQFESLPHAMVDEFKFPSMRLAQYDVVAAFDHATDQGWLISQGFPAKNSSERHRLATKRLDLFQSVLEGKVHASRDRWPSPVEIASPLHEVAYGLRSNFSQATYESAVARIVEYIHAGDVFQVNLSQRLLHPCGEDPVRLYRQLRQSAAAPFAGYFDAGGFQVLSASPERFLSLRGDQVESRPIKGTARLTGDPGADQQMAQALFNSAKERSENIMIVDLMRNDLSKVCDPDSVCVSQLCQLEPYGYVQHLVSAVEGQLSSGCSAHDLLAATFPGGSVTGAPKVRAMQIITELEGVARGPYCGALGYVSSSGDLDTSILIRTATLAGGWLQIPVGGGVVADSDPTAEYEETWAKAEPFLRALRLPSIRP